MKVISKMFQYIDRWPLGTLTSFSWQTIDSVGRIDPPNNGLLKARRYGVVLLHFNL